MPIIIGRFQNKTDLVPGPDKFTGIQARDQLYIFSFLLAQAMAVEKLGLSKPHLAKLINSSRINQQKEFTVT